MFLAHLAPHTCILGDIEVQNSCTELAVYVYISNIATHIILEKYCCINLNGTQAYAVVALSFGGSYIHSWFNSVSGRSYENLSYKI
jgi:hypothetical protein